MERGTYVKREMCHVYLVLNSLWMLVKRRTRNAKWRMGNDEWGNVKRGTWNVERGTWNVEH